MNNAIGRSICRATVLTLLLTVAAPPVLAGRIEGHGRFEKIKGKPHMGYVELYETNLFLSPSVSPPIGPSRRLGTTSPSGSSCSNVVTHDGAYCIEDMPAGTYSILMNQPLFYVAPKVITDVQIPVSGSITVNPELAIDYSTYYKNDWTSTANSVWYQTFVATGNAVRGVAFSFAGNIPSWIQVGLLADNGNPDVRSWPIVAERTEPSVGDVTDNWVRFRSAEAPTIPGQRYAIRLMAVGAAIQPYKRNKDLNSYVGGQAYNANGVAQDFDMNITVFSDNDGTTVTMNKRTETTGTLVDGFFASKWGHTFVARGASLAAVDIWAAGAEHKWDIDFLWKIYPASDPTGPSGEQIGPTKVTKAAYQSFGVGLHGVSYNPNEVPLVTGQKYFIEFSALNPPPESPGFNPYTMDNDSYDEGMAYQWSGSNWTARTSVDLAMTILEYKPLDPAMLLLSQGIDRRAFYTGNAAPATFQIANAGNGSFNYVVQSDSAWMSTIPAEGTVSDQLETITINFQTSGLAVGNYAGNLVISSVEAINSPQVLPVTVEIALVPADFDADLDVDITDFALLQACFTGQGIIQNDPACLPTRLDEDDDVDQGDAELFLQCLSGPGVLPNPYCMDP